MNGALQRYRSASANSGITDFALMPNGIIVLFRNGSAYLYTDDKPGRYHVRNMHTLAAAGRGLTTYISQNVGSNYAESLTPEQVAAVMQGI